MDSRPSMATRPYTSLCTVPFSRCLADREMECDTTTAVADHRKVATGGWGSVPGFYFRFLILIQNLCLEKVKKGEGELGNEATS